MFPWIKRKRSLKTSVKFTTKKVIEAALIYKGKDETCYRTYYFHHPYCSHHQINLAQGVNLTVSKFVAKTGESSPLPQGHTHMSARNNPNVKHSLFHEQPVHAVLTCFVLSLHYPLIRFRISNINTLLLARSLWLSCLPEIVPILTQVTRFYIGKCYNFI